MVALNFNSIKPQLNRDVEIHMVSDNEYILYQTQLNHQIRVNKLTVDLLSITNGDLSISELSNNISKVTGKLIDEGTVYELLYGTLFKRGFIDRNPDADLRRSLNYLSLRFILIPKKIVNLISSKFSFIFVGAIFFFVSLICLFVVSIINNFIFFQDILQSKQEIKVDEMAILYFMLFGFVISLLHEIGHASALQFYQKQAGEIGVGFYLFYPVFYCNVSEAWFLRKQNRIVVNLAGIYFELIVSGIFIAIFQFTDKIIYAWLSSIILFRTLLNLNPFLRRDGYWILSDVANIPNLQEDSIKYVKKTITSLFKRQAIHLDFRPFILLYGILSMSFILFFILFVVILNPSSIIHFPISFWNFISDSANHEFTLTYFLIILNKFGLSFLFYYLLFKLIIRFIKSYFIRSVYPSK